jgi:phosphopantothenoylcysteine decarboxylase/phosphopantothenate--cysteine ligase
MTQRYLWPELAGRRVLLGVSGGVAAYKAAELCRLLVRAGATVDVMMTRAAREFVGVVTFGALSGRPVGRELFDPAEEAQIGHIALADRAEVCVLAPATANLLAKLAHGLADDLVSTVCLAYHGPLLCAPAMNVHMWEHPATKENLATLRRRGVRSVGPGAGEMACGHVGEGRMAEPEEILQAVGACLAPQDLAGRKILVSGGPTHEPLDPVRFLGNRSSGKMGFALAAEASARGAEVILVAGPSALATPWGVTRVDVSTATEMGRAIREHAAEQAAIVMAAAVADYRPVSRAAGKLKKEALGASPSLELERTEDILAGLRAIAPHAVLVGFAAETGEGSDGRAAAKLEAKRCDLLVGNDVSAAGAGFEVDTNRVVILEAGEGGPRRDPLPLLSKRAVARQILDRVARRLERGP